MLTTSPSASESDPGFSQSSHQLRCSAIVVPPYRSRYRSSHQEDPQYPNSKWFVALRAPGLPVYGPCAFWHIHVQCDKRLMTVSCVAIVSAPLWDSHTGRFAGLLTSTDYINVVQYYWQFPDEMSKLDQFRLSSLRGEYSSSLASALSETDDLRS